MYARSALLVWLALALASCYDLFNHHGHGAHADTHAHTHHAKTRLQDIQALALHQGQMTTGRRTAPVLQLACVGGSACKEYTPSTVQCYNRGSDGFDANWECTADLDTDYRFGETTVVCEGFDHPDDPFVLAGSCAVEYTLEHTSQGLNNLGNNRDRKPMPSSGRTWFIDAAVTFFLVVVLLQIFLSVARGRSDGFGTGFVAGSAFSQSHHRPISSFSRSSRNSCNGRSSGTRTASGFGGTRRR